MKKSNLILFLLFILTGTLYYTFTDNPQTTGNSLKIIESKVTRVIDGDTLELENGDRIRMLGINTPEKKTFLSNESLKFTQQLENKTVKIEITEKDKYGRNLGYVFYKDKLFNEEILRNGLAHTFIYDDDKYSKQLRQTEKEAIDKKIGLWKNSPNFGCLQIKEFNHVEETRCTNQEILKIENFCNEMNIYLKDDATHDEFITLPKGIFIKNFSCIFNDEGDSLYIWDDKGLLIFERYS